MECSIINICCFVVAAKCSKTRSGRPAGADSNHDQPAVVASHRRVYCAAARAAAPEGTMCEVKRFNCDIVSVVNVSCDVWCVQWSSLANSPSKSLDTQRLPSHAPGGVRASVSRINAGQLINNS